MKNMNKPLEYKFQERLGRYDIKGSFKYYTPLNFFNCISHCVYFTRNPFELEFFTEKREDCVFIKDYLLKEFEDSRIRFNISFDYNYNYYTIDMTCLGFIQYIKELNNPNHNNYLKYNEYCNLVKKNMWNDIDLEEGYNKYMSKVHNSFMNDTGNFLLSLYEIKKHI